MENESEKPAKREVADPIRIGYSLSLSGILAPNGKTAFLVHKLWEENINNKEGCLDCPFNWFAWMIRRIRNWFPEST